MAPSGGSSGTGTQITTFMLLLFGAGLGILAIIIGLISWWRCRKGRSTKRADEIAYKAIDDEAKPNKKSSKRGSDLESYGTEVSEKSKRSEGTNAKNKSKGEKSSSVTKQQAKGGKNDPTDQKQAKGEKPTDRVKSSKRKDEQDESAPESPQSTKRAVTGPI